MDAEKKRLFAAEQDPVARAAWWDSVTALPREALVFVDETHTSIAMTRRYAWAPRSARAVGQVPRNHGVPTSVVAAVGVDGLGAVMSLPGAVDREAFTVYVRDLLCPTLQPGQIVVMDNLSVHKGAGIRALIEAAGCTTLFLPSYSPDYAPIELCFSKVKTQLRAIGARTQEALDVGISAAIETITAADAHGWFTHCGYPACST